MFFVVASRGQDSHEGWPRIWRALVCYSDSRCGTIYTYIIISKFVLFVCTDMASMLAHMSQTSDTHTHQPHTNTHTHTHTYTCGPLLVLPHTKFLVQYRRQWRDRSRIICAHQFCSHMQWVADSAEQLTP
jgi:hypothetical protein